MGLCVVLQVGLGNLCHMGPGIVLLPMPGSGTEEFDDGGEELVLKYLPVDGAVDVAHNDEWPNEPPPRYCAINMYRGGVPVVADRLGLLTIQYPLAIIPGVVTELSRHESRVGDDETSVPVGSLGVQHVAVSLP